MNWTYLAAGACYVTAVCLFMLHTATDPKHHHWLDMPLYLRGGIALSGTMFLISGVVLSTAVPATTQLGMFTALALITLLCVGYTVSALTLWVLRRQMPARAWMRVNWFERKQRENPDIAPLLLRPDEVTHVARAAGFTAVGPGASTKDFVEIAGRTRLVR